MPATAGDGRKWKVPFPYHLPDACHIPRKAFLLLLLPGRPAYASLESDRRRR